MSKVNCSQCNKPFEQDEVIQVEGSWVCAACKPVAVQKMKEGVSVAANLNYAGFWIRFCAVFIDGLLLNIVNYLLGMVLGTSIFSRDVDSALGAAVLANVVAILIAALYEILMIGKYGATLGKMATKLRVVTPEGQPIGYGTATGRYFAKILSSVILLIGYIMAAFDGEKRALHDRICNTRVVRV